MQSLVPKGFIDGPEHATRASFAVQRVTDHRVAGFRQMHTYLMGPSCFQSASNV